MPAQLVALTDGPNIVLDRPILLIGRHPECDIHIDSRKISRRHCCIAQVQDYLVVRDLDSTNGVRINGVRVQEGKLRPGDELSIGNHRYRVEGEQEAHPPAPAKPPPVQEPRDDEALESCDEPVALSEPLPQGMPRHVPRAGPAPGKAASSPPSLIPEFPPGDVSPSSPPSKSPSHS